MNNPSQLLRVRDIDLGDNLTLGWVGDKLELTLGAKDTLDSDSQVFPLAANQGNLLNLAKLGRHEYARGVRIDSTDQDLPIIILTKTEFYALPERARALYVVIPQYPGGVVTESKLFMIPERETVPAEGKTVQAYVDADPLTEWALTVPEGVIASVTTGTGPTLVTFTVLASEELTSRTFSITATCGALTAAYTILQAGVDGTETITVAPTSIAFNNTYGEQYNAVVTIEPTAAAWMVLSKSPWIAVFPSSGASGDPVRIMCAFNGSEVERSGFVDFCKKGYPDMHVILTITQAGSGDSITVPATLSLAATDGSQAFQLTTQGLSGWELVTPLPDWLELSATTGPNSTSITATALDNTGALRDIELTFRLVDYPEVTDTIAITQAADVDVFDISPAIWQAAFQYDETVFTVTATGAWTLTVPEWVAVTTVTGTFDPVTMTGSGNATIQAVVTWSGTPRTDTLTLTSGALTDSSTVNQAGGSAGIGFSSDVWAPAATGGTLDMLVTSSGAWTLTLPDEVTASVTSGVKGRTATTLTIGSNTTLDIKTLHVTSTVGTITADLTITQDSVAGVAVMTTDADGQYAANTTGDTIVVKIWPKSSTWTLGTSDAWVTLGAASGTGDTNVNATWSANGTETPKTSTLTVTAASSATDTVGLELLGAAPSASVNPSSLSFVSAGESKNIAVTATGAWTASITGTGFSITSGSSGTGNGTIVVGAAANTDEERTGMVTLHYGSGQTIDIGLTQADGCVLTISPSSYDYLAAGGSCVVTITANGAWNATVPTGDGIWYSGGGSGTGNSTVTYTAAANGTTSTRQHVVSIVRGSVTRTFTMNQAAGAATVSVNPTSQSFTDTSVSHNIAVTANGAWTAAVTGTGFSITAGASGSGNGTITVLAATNTGSERTGTLTVTREVGVTATTSLTQAAAMTFALTWAINSLTEVEVPYDTTAASLTIDLTEGVAWEVTSNDAWMSPSSTSGTGGGSITVTYGENTGTARSGSISLTAGGVTRTCTLNQTAAAADSVVLSYTDAGIFGDDVGKDTATLAASSTATLTAKSAALTLTVGGSAVTAPSGTIADGSTIAIAASANTGTSRELTFDVGVGSASASYSQLQRSPPGATEHILLSRSTVGIKLNGTTTVYVLSGSGGWTATESDSKFNVSPTSGSSGGTFAVSGTTTATGSGTVTVANGAASASVTVDVTTTSAPTTTGAVGTSAAYPTSWADIPATAGNAVRVQLFSAGVSWSLDSFDSAIIDSITPSSGSGGCTEVVITLKANTTTSSRTTNVIFIPNTGSTVVVSLTQLGAPA